MVVSANWISAKNLGGDALGSTGWHRDHVESIRLKRSEHILKRREPVFPRYVQVEQHQTRPARL
jgi:hypothetical protein